MSWADANMDDDHSAEVISNRISNLEETIHTHLSEIRTEVSLAAAAMRSTAPGALGSASPLGDLEEQLARAVTVSLSAALEAIRESLTQAVSSAVAQLASRLEAKLDSQSGPIVHTQLNAADLDELAASLQHSVLVALSSFEQTAAVPLAPSNEALATVRDVARVNQRIDELRSLLLG